MFEYFSLIFFAFAWCEWALRWYIQGCIRPCITCVNSYNIPILTERHGVHTVYDENVMAQIRIQKLEYKT